MKKAQFVYSRHDDGSLVAWQIDTGEAIWKIADEARRVIAVSLHKDASRMVVIYEAGGIDQIDRATGKSPRENCPPT